MKSRFGRDGGEKESQEKSTGERRATLRFLRERNNRLQTSAGGTAERGGGQSKEEWVKKGLASQSNHRSKEGNRGKEAKATVGPHSANRDTEERKVGGKAGGERNGSSRAEGWGEGRNIGHAE